uniref:Leucine-rich repeat transmembrane neuronal protein 4-like n=1 Tax=Cyprinodon variegatus TaxID=28743 RepID=A0A3Q2E9S7_CYPVA
MFVHVFFKKLSHPFDCLCPTLPPTGSVMLDWRLSCLLLQTAVLLLLSKGERMCPATCRCEGKIVYCESNGLKQILIRTFLECRSLEFLDLGYNRLRSLTRTTFLGLFKLRELHLEHNQFSRVNFYIFPRLTNLQALYLSWNRIRSISQGVPWTWPKLQKLDLSGNEIQTLEPDVFRCMPSLQMLNLETNKLSSVPVEVVEAWTSLTTISLAGNAWDCNINMICSGPKAAQVTDLSHPSSPAGTHIQTAEPTALSSTLPSSTETSTSFIPELQFEHMAFHKIIAGSVALFLSVALILLISKVLLNSKVLFAFHTAKTD